MIQSGDSLGFYLMFLKVYYHKFFVLFQKTHLSEYDRRTSHNFIWRQAVKSGTDSTI